MEESHIENKKDLWVQFEGFRPSEDAQQKFEGLLEQILDEAPSASFLQTKIYRHRELFKGMMQINSPVGKFFASGVATDLDEVGKDLIRHMRSNLDRWKAHRFQEGTHGEAV